MSTDTNSLRLFEIFHPKAAQRLVAIKESKRRFVHYTSAEAALGILMSQEFWMRDPSCMNDFSEVEYGLRNLEQSYKHSEAGKNFRKAIEQIAPNVNPWIDGVYLQSPMTPRHENYIACLSEHLDSEDEHGRLSMWRAYGAGGGVALVLNQKNIIDSPGMLNLIVSPVEYFEQKHFDKVLDEVANNVIKNIDFLKTIQPEQLLPVIVSMFRLAALSTKHPGFREEREWRVIHSPELVQSDYMRRESRSINGVPQTIYKIPLRKVADGVETGAEIAGLVDRIIIGPTNFPAAIGKAFKDVLQSAGVSNPAQRIVFSQIPLRT